MEQNAFGGILCLLRSDWSLRWLDVCICTDASEMGFAFASREGCRELASEAGRVSEPDKVQEKLQGPSVPGHVRFAPSHQKSNWNGSGSDEDEVSLARTVARTSRKCRCNFWNPLSEWKLVAHGALFGNENIKVLEARSILYACPVCRELLSAGTPPCPY